MLPLLLLGRYSPPFLDWIESAAVTTSVTDGSAVLRGVTDWVAYIADAAGPQWPAGWSLVSERLLVVGTVLVAVVGVVGLARPGVRHRRFLLVSLLVGVVALVAPHVSPAGPWADGLLAPQLRTLLDGALAPLRNVHKFDVWVRLPLALGVGWAVAALMERARRTRLSPTTPVWAWHSARWWAPRLALVGVAASLLLTGAPAWRGDLTTGRTFGAVPGYWLDTASWLSSAPVQGRALVVPGASFGIYLWGDSRDEPLQAYARTPWAVRDAVPLSSAGNIRALDAVEALFSSGRGSAALAAYLQRMGVSYLVVRNDLDYTAVDSPRPVLVHQTLSLSGGFARAVGFGPLLGGFGVDEAVGDGGVDPAYQAVEVFAVGTDQGDRRVTVRDASALDVVEGESESLLPVLSIPGAEDRPAVRAEDLPDGLGVARTVVADTDRRTEVDFGRVHDNRSSTLVPDAPWTLARSVHDYVVTPPAPGPVAVVAPTVTVEASTSRGDAASVRIDPAAGAWNAVDGNVLTSWFPRTYVRGEQWWQVSRDAPLPTGRIVIVPATDPPGTAGSVTLRITADTGSQDVRITLPTAAATLPAVPGPTRSLRITVLESSLPNNALFGLAEVRLPGLVSTRTLVTTPAAAAGPTALALSVRPGSRAACVVRDPAVCFPPLARTGEESGRLDRVVRTGGIDGALALTLLPRPGLALDRLLQPTDPSAALARASSVIVPDAPARPQAAIDRDPSTAWVASPLDPAPTLTVTLGRPRTVSYLRVVETPGLGSSRPLGVTVTVGGRRYPVFSDDRGYLRFPPTRTRSIRLEITSTRPVVSIDTRLRVTSVLPVGISELVLGEADDQRVGVARDAVVTVPCGFAPNVVVVGTTQIATKATTTVGALLDGAPVDALRCTDGNLPAGEQRLLVEPTAEFDVARLTWAAASRAASRFAAPVVTSWTSTSRTVDVPRGLGRPHPRARREREPGLGRDDRRGQELAPLRVDGWRQAWIVPPAWVARSRCASPRTASTAAPCSGEGRRRSCSCCSRRARCCGVRGPWWSALARPGPDPGEVCAAGPWSWGCSRSAAPGSSACSRGSGSPAARAARRWTAGIGVGVATAAALLAPWPVGTTYAESWQVGAAVAASVGLGLVLGALSPRRPRLPATDDVHEDAGAVAPSGVADDGGVDDEGVDEENDPVSGGAPSVVRDVPPAGR